MRSLVNRCGSDPEYSGLAPGAHVALSLVITGNLNKVTGFRDVSQQGQCYARCVSNQIEYAHCYGHYHSECYSRIVKYTDCWNSYFLLLIVILKTSPT